MTIACTATETGEGTDIVGPARERAPGVSPADNELGRRMWIDKLARPTARDG